jgi:citrate synthase
VPNAIFSELGPEIVNANSIPQDLYEKYEVKRGLRDKDGSGVRAGLTKISAVMGNRKAEWDTIPIEGELLYRGVNIRDIMESFGPDSRHCFERVVFLLLVGCVCSEAQLNTLETYIGSHMSLPEVITQNIIEGLPGKNVMNKLQTCISALYGYDQDPDALDSYENFIKSLNLIAKFPTIIAYAYLTASKPNPKFVAPKPEYSLAENFLYMLREGTPASAMEAHILDLCLVLHAEHGGGNNSTFTTHVISSTNSDIYSAIVGSLGSLKGPLHGAANQKVMEMMANIANHVKDWNNVDELSAYLTQIIEKKANDKSGKIYGLGHAVYTLSDPRAILLKEHAENLAKSKGREKELKLYYNVEKLGPELFQKIKGDKKVISANVDFFSGFVYDCLGIPEPVYTAMFAMARVAGWCAHRIEENISGKRIIRPGYKFVG